MVKFFEGESTIETITVIDAPCGAGKTSWAIQRMNADTETRYIFCTPFLDEITRIKRSCFGRCFREPEHRGGRKIDDFNRLLSEGANIAVTHHTLLNSTSETLELIRMGSYTLILDEALDVINPFNRLDSVENDPTQTISSGDIRLMLNSNLIAIDEKCKVHWIGQEYSDSKFSEVEYLAKQGALYCAQQEMLLYIFPPEIFGCFTKIYAMTYLFTTSILRCYFKIYSLPYSLSSIAKDEGGYHLIDFDYEIDLSFRSHCKGLIQICDIERLNTGYGRYGLSKGWFHEHMKNPEDIQRLKRDLEYFFQKYANAHTKNYDILWTCPTEYKKLLKGRGYTCVRRPRKGEDLTEDELKRLDCHLSLNAKGVNDYGNRWALAYVYNMFFNTMLRNFLYALGAEIDEDLFAVSCMIQWIFRSRIRNGESIVIYIPSDRMRNLLRKWLDGTT